MLIITKPLIFSLEPCLHVHAKKPVGTFVPPLLIISLLVSQIPILGGIAGFVLANYQMYLYIVATQAAQNVTMGKATVAVLLPGLLVLCCVVVFGFSLAAAILGSGALNGF
jgi:hypothetical protein